MRLYIYRDSSEMGMGQVIHTGQVSYKIIWQNPVYLPVWFINFELVTHGCFAAWYVLITQP